MCRTPARHCTWWASMVLQSGHHADVDASALLFLDFDGVVCDSEAECFASSWLTWHEHFAPPAPDRVARALRRRFRALRPLISSGEDYVLIQQLIAAEQDGGDAFPADQATFDNARKETGPERMGAYKTTLAETRGAFINGRKAQWLRLNPLYPHVRDLLVAAGDLGRVRILSTKAPQLIEAILHAAGIHLAASSIMYAPSRPGGRDARKLELIEDELQRSALDAAVFVEDQFEHLVGPCRLPVRRLLCDWGYALPALLADGELLAGHEVSRVSAGDLAALMTRVTG